MTGEFFCFAKSDFLISEFLISGVHVLIDTAVSFMKCQFLLTA